MMLILTLLQTLIMNASILSAWWFYAPGIENTTVETMLYCVLHRIAWAIPISWIIVVHSSNISGK